MIYITGDTHGEFKYRFNIGTLMIGKNMKWDNEVFSLKGVRNV